MATHGNAKSVGLNIEMSDELKSTNKIDGIAGRIKKNAMNMADVATTKRAISNFLRGKIYRENHKQELEGYYIKNKSHILEKRRKYRQLKTGDAVFREKGRQAIQKSRKAKPDKYRALNHKYRSGSVGEFTGEEWQRLRESFGNRCLRCYTTEKIAIDHVVPLSKGGANTIDNIQPLCKRCNTAKGTRSWDFRAKEINAVI